MSKIKKSNKGKGILPELEIPEGFAEDMDKFMQVVSKKPNKNRVIKNKYANDAEYLPIGYVESLLDKIFINRWDVKAIGQPQFAGNSCTITLELKYFDPITKEWRTRMGVGSVPVQTDKKGELKPKAMQKAPGAAKSVALKNAAKSIGNIFGRGLNRSGEDNVSMMYKSKPVN